MLPAGILNFFEKKIEKRLKNSGICSIIIPVILILFRYTCAGEMR